MSDKKNYSERGKFTDGNQRPRESAGRIRTRHQCQDAIDAVDRTQSTLAYARDLEERTNEKAKKRAKK